ncbi:MAG: efflux RND transporter periplasmic adaptor subunit [Candidatus Aminicenantes bacterium]|nr:efflux RND transporter periplasmic adaptor subunit [Candidatus Aminicenantes bacterium]
MKGRSLLFLITVVLTVSACQTKAPQAELDHAVALTQWSEKLEVFMEYQMPTPGEVISFGVHLTDLSDFKPILEGTLELEFTHENSGQSFIARAEQPIRDGIFSPTHTFKTPGIYRFILSLESPNISDRMDLGTIQVYPTLPDIQENEKSSVDAVSFLKEQQWKMEFGIKTADRRNLTQTLSVPGKIVPAAYRMAKISPPLDGKITLDRKISLPKLGDKVQAGDVLAIIEPSLDSFSSSGEYQIEQEMSNSEALLNLAQKELERLKKLDAEDAIPKKRLYEAETALNIARTNYEKALNKKEGFKKIKLLPGGENGSVYYFIRSPITGRVVDLYYSLGEQVKGGDQIMTILDDSRVWLEISIFEDDVSKIKNSQGGYFIFSDREKTYGLDKYEGNLTFFGSVIDESTRTVKVIYEITNPEKEFFVGSFITVYLNTAETLNTLVLPKSAVFESGGSKVCFVQIDGESFEKRVIQLGIEGQNFVQVLSGLQEGEKVVVVGGFAVKLAAEATGKDVGEGHYH